MPKRSDPPPKAAAPGIFDKGLPAAEDVERFVLGSILLGHVPLTEIPLQPEDFSLESHRRIWGRMNDLAGRGEKVDRITLANELMSQGQIDSIGGFSYLVSLDEGLPELANLDAYVRIVQEKSRLRQLIFAGQRQIDRALMGDTAAAEIATEAAEKLVEIQMAGDDQAGGGQTPLQVVENFPGGIDTFMNPTLQARGLPTGLKRVDEMIGGLERGNVYILAARPSMGKAQPLDEPVVMADGTSRPIGSLQIGDKIASPDAELSEVLGIFPQGVKSIFTVTFRDGRSTRCCADHLWTITCRHWGEKTVTTRELQRLLTRKRYKNRIYIPVTQGFFGSERELPLDPWFMGYLLGNGNMTGTSPIVTVPFPEMVEKVRGCVEAIGLNLNHVSRYDYRIAQTNRWAKGTSGVKPNPLASLLATLGVHRKRCFEKSIPNCFMLADRDSRLEILRGLLDSDGTAEKTGAIVFSSSSRTMALQVRDLARSVGCLSACNKKATPHFTYKGVRKQGIDAWVVTISPPNHKLAFFYQKSKLERASHKTRLQRLNVESVLEEICEEECVCISVSHPTGLYVTSEYICTHNTALALNIAQFLALDERLHKAPVVLSLEMSNSSLMTRMMCSAGRVNMHEFRNGRLGQDERRKLQMAMADLNDSRLMLYDNIKTMPEIMKALRKEAARGMHLAVVDYLQLIGSHGKVENRNQEVSLISRQFKLAAKELDVPLLILSQLSRLGERRADQRPRLDDLRDSGSIEQDADVVMFIFREEVYKKDRSDLKGVAELIVGKQRNGDIGTVPLRFIGHLTRFEDRSDWTEPEGQ